MDFNEVLQTHKKRAENGTAPTVADIAPKVQRPTASAGSTRSTAKARVCIGHLFI